MNALNIRELNPVVQSLKRNELLKSRLIINYAHESTRALLKAIEDVNKIRNNAENNAGEEQDLLRAILVFSAAGLDSTIKQLIRDALPSLVEIDDKVRQGLETFVVRQLRSDNETSSNTNKFLARVLIADSHQKQIVREYINDLTGKSMQSPEEVMKAAYALGLEPSEQNIEPIKLKVVFDIRNKIIHELDINFDAPPQHRHKRNKIEMVGYANNLLEIGEKILLGVSEKLIHNQGK